MKIEIGSVTEEFLGEDDDGEATPPNKYCAYVAVDVTIDGKTVSTARARLWRETEALRQTRGEAFK